VIKSITLKAFSSSSNLKVIYIPRCTSLGATVGNDLVFDTVINDWILTKLYVSTSLQTVNSGAPDGDITFFISKGGTEIYVSNFNSPSIISNLSVISKTRTSVQLGFTIPTGNTIDYYELYNNDVFLKNIPTSGYIEGLSQLTNYNFSVIAVDVYYNKSLKSNVVSVVTDTTSMPLDGLISYFDFSEESGLTAYDSYGTNNGTHNAMTVGVPSKIGKGVKGIDYRSYVNLNKNNITGGKSAFSVSMWFKISSLGNTNALYGSWSGAQVSLLIRLSGGSLQFFMFSASQTGGSFIAFSDIASWHHMVCTYDGSTMKMYLDGTVSPTTFAKTGTLNTGTLNERIGDAQSAGSPNSFDETAIYSRALTAGEVTTIYNGGNGITL